MELSDLMRHRNDLLRELEDLGLFAETLALELAETEQLLRQLKNEQPPVIKIEKGKVIIL